MKKMKMHSPNLTQENIDYIRKRFPGCVAEARGKYGKLKLSIDFDQLRQELSESIVEGVQERYHLNWPGKKEALLTTKTLIAKTLRPHRKESVNFATTKNLFIEGDNLEALKMLQETYLGKIKMIYIDPPYNTGNDLIYEDDLAKSTAHYVQESNQVDEEGNRLVANFESNGRFHSSWLSMMYPRLKLARNVLREDGVIFISIDDNEQSSLKKLCDEIFGANNFIGVFVINSTPNARDYGHIGKMHEYVLVCAKDLSSTRTYQMPVPDKKFKYSDKYGEFNIHPLYNSNVAFHKGTSPSLYYEFYLNPKEKSGDFYNISLRKQDGFIAVYPPVSIKEKVQFVWRWGKQKAEREINKEIVGYKTSNGEFRIMQKMRHSTKLIRSLLLDKKYSTRRGTAEVEEIFNKKIFSFPKPVSLIIDFITCGTAKDDIILDLFAGSSTTAHAVMKLNAEDGCNRKFIMVQIPEVCDQKTEAAKTGYATIAEISKERIRRAGKKVLEGECHVGWDKDIGFRVLKVDSSNMKDVYYTPGDIDQGQLEAFTDNIKPDREPEDLLFHVLLDWGVNLSLPIRKETIQGKTVFFVDENALVACFDTGVDEKLVKELARIRPEPLRMVFRDSGFVSDSVKINVEQFFKQMSPSTVVKTI